MICRDLRESKATIQFAVSVRACTKQVRNLWTECAFSQMEYERKPNSGMGLVNKKAGHNRPASNHWSFQFLGNIDRNTSFKS